MAFTKTSTGSAGLREKAARAFSNLFGSKKDKNVENNSKDEHPLRNKISHPIPMELVEFERVYREATGSAS